MERIKLTHSGLKAPTKKSRARKVAPTKVKTEDSSVKRVSKKLFKEDVKHTATLVRAGRVGAANAIRTSKALGLTITYIESGSVIQELPNGEKKVITTVSSISHKNGKQSLKKGMIFNVKK